MNTAYIALGSNLAGRLSSSFEQVESGVKALQELGELKDCSPWYESQAIGGQQQNDYINGVVCLYTSLNSEQLLDGLQAIENRHGRLRLEHWGPRTLDLDILLFNDAIINSQRLIIPHRQMLLRNFVIYPLHDIAPDLILPNGQALSHFRQRIGHKGLKKIS